MEAASQTLQRLRKDLYCRGGKVHEYVERSGGDFPLGICPQWANPHKQWHIRLCICSGSECMLCYILSGLHLTPPAPLKIVYCATRSSLTNALIEYDANALCTNKYGICVSIK